MNGIVSLQEFPVDPNTVPVTRPTPSAADLDQITNAIGGGANSMLMLNSGIDRGNDIAMQNQIIADRQSMSPLDFEAKYGSEIMRQMDMLAGADAERYLMENTDRSMGARVGDNVNNVFTGLVGGLGDAATFVGGMVNRDVGRVFSDGTAWFREGMQGFQSTAQQRNRYINGIRAELDRQDNQRQYEQDRADGDSAFVAGLSYLGRGLVNGASRFIEDPTSLETGVAEGVGSLFAGGAIGKGLGIAGRLAGVGQRATAAMMPAAIGAMEGGSAYSGAMQEVMGMTHEDLAANSPTYRALIASGVSPEQAREQVASQAAEIAGMVQAPIGALTGRLVSRFEANPLGSKGFRDMVRNILNETVEEGAQSASGQFAQNLGVRQADENQMLIEGIGDQTAQGAILGSLTAGAIQTPNIPGAALRSAASALRTRAEALQAQNEAGSGVTDEDIQAAAATVAENMGAVAEATDAMIEAIPEEIRDEIGTNSLRDRIINAVTVTDADMESLGTEANEYLENTGQNVRENRISLLANTARMVVDPNSPMEAKLSGALFLLSEMNKQGKLFGEDLEEAKSGLDQESAEYQTVNNYQSVMAQIASNPTMRSAMEWAGKVSNVEAPADVVRATTAKPSAISPETGRTVLKQADEGNISLTPAQRKAVQNSIDVVQIAQKAEALKEQAEREADPDFETDAVKDVNDQVMTRGREEDWGLSVDQHVARINTAVENGDPVALGAALRHFGNFAASQRNKGLAAIKSIREGGEKEFARAGAYGKRNPVNGRITIHPNSPSSVAFGRRVIIEANALIEQANALMDANPVEGLDRRLKTIPLPVEFFGEQVRQQEAQETVQQGERKKETSTVEKQYDENASVLWNGILVFPAIFNGMSPNDFKVNEINNSGTFKFAYIDNNNKRITGTFDYNDYEQFIDNFVITSENGANNLGINTIRFIGRKLAEQFPKAVGLAGYRETGARGGSRDNPIPLIFDIKDGRLVLRKGGEQETVQETPSLSDPIVVEDQNVPEVFPEAETAPVVTETVYEPVVEKDERSAIEKRFPFLYRAKEAGSRFHQAFRGDRSGPLLDRVQPLREFYEALENSESLKEFVGSDPKFTVDADQTMALQQYLLWGRDLIVNPENGVQKRLADFLKMPYNSEKPEGPSFGDLLLEGRDVVGTNQGRALGIVEQTSDGIRYNPALLQTATLAALHWFAGSQNRETYLDKEDVAKLTGLKVDEISNAKVDEFNSGVGLQQAVRGLAENISEFWGLNADKNAPENLTKGIPEGIAKELLRAMQAQGFFTSGTIRVPGSNKTYTQFYFGENITSELRSLMREMGPAKKLLEMAATREDNRFAPTYDEAPKGIAPTQIRNRAVRNTRFQRGVIRKAQNIAFHFYRNSYDMQRAIGKDAWIELMGSTVIRENTPFNEEHLNSVKGRNLTISNAFDALEDQVAELEAYADKLGKSPEEVRKYYQFNYSRVNRLQMLGLVNPQSDKIARHVFLPTKTTVDLTDPNSRASMGFFMSLAQGLDIQKVQNFTPEQNAAAARAATVEEGGKYAALVTELAEWLRNGKQGSLAEWSGRLRAVDGGVTEHGVMSLLAAAEYMNARDLGGLKTFTTHSYFEADGVTNGPANALMNLSTMVSPSWIETIRKGGAFIGHAAQTMVDQAGQADLYTTAASLLTQLQRDFASNLPDNVREVHDALFRVMQALGMKIDLKDNGDGTLSVTFDRKVLKNPLTITIYGSGIDGIAGNVTSELLDNFYAAISEHLQSGRGSIFGDNMVVNGEPYGAAKLKADLKQVLGQSVYREEGEWVVAKATKPVQTGTSLANLTITPDGFAILKDNVRALLVDNMNTAIEQSVMGHVKEMVDTIQKATNAQSIILHYMFRKELMREMAARQMNPEKYPGYKRGDFLSQAELDGILKRLMPYGAVINTKSQSFFLGSGERGNLLDTQELTVDGQTIKVRMPKAFSRDLTGGYQTDAYAFSPSIAGVGGVPSFNIGTGDGRMIDVFLQKLAGYGVLPVFDGINLPVDRVFEGSLEANSAVMQTWSENPVQYVAESFAAFLRNDPLSSMFDPTDPFNVEMEKLAEELTRNEQGTRRVKEVYDPEYIQAHFNSLNDMLSSGAEQIGTRIEAMKQMPMSVDQMAGGNTSYQQEGTVKLPASPNSTTVAQALTRIIEKVQKSKKKQDAVEAPSRNFMAAFRSKALTDEATGAMVADLPALDAIRKTLNNKMPNTQREMLAASLNALSDSDFRVVLGTPESVDRWEANNYPDAYEANVDSFYGKIDVENRVIYLTNPSVETLAHEMIHAATITKMQGYYADNGSVTDTDGESIQRLEGLMNEWLVQSYDREGPAVAVAHRMAMSTIVGYLNQGKKAEAVNEFLAWSLTNQNIINIQKKMQVKNPLYMVLDKAISALKRLIWGHKKAPEIGTDMFSQVRFNARVLMATPTPVELFLRDLSQTVMFQSSSFGSDSRLSELRRVFGEHMVSYARKPVSTDPLVNKATYKSRRQDALDALIRTDRIGQAMAIPFKFNMQQMSTFKWIGATLSMVDHLNTASLDRMQDIFDAVIDKITPEDFMYNTGDEGADRYQAQQKYNALTGINTTQYDKQGRSSQLTNFIGLVAVDPQFRDILRKMQMPQRLVPKGMSADALVDRATQGMAAGLAAYATGQGRNNENLLASMDALTQSLIENVGDQRSFIEQSVDNGLDKVDNIIKTYIEKGTGKFQKWATTVQNPVGKKVSSWLSMLSKEFTAEGKKSLDRTRISFMNQPEINTTLRSAVNEVIGRTEENAPIFDMITRTKTLVDQTRQRWRDEFPKEIRKWFKEPLTAKQWSDLYRAARTDMSVLFETHTRDRTLELLSSGSARKAEIARLEKLMGADVIAKSKQLANFMVTGDAGIMLRPNAHAIHKLDAKVETKDDIENLVTLYALEQSDKDVQNTLKNLIENDLDGFEKLYMALVSTRADEMQKVNSPVAMMNHTKGYIRGLNQEGVHLLIASRNDHAKLIGKGYTDLGDYVGSSADIGTEKKGYYFAPVSGRARFNQGIIQTVQWTQFGVDPQTGYTVGEITAGRVSDPRTVAAITKRINRSNKTTENLRPIYGENGVVTAYERMADPMKLTNLNPSQDLAAALGAWRGRQTEELSSQAVNEELVDKVYNQWLDGKRDRRTNEYERIDQSKDPIIRDAWAVVPKHTKDYIKAKFGDAGFRVRRDLVEDVIGARSATVGDFWTGNSRWSPETQKQIRDMIVGFAGNDAYRYLVNAEKFYQDIITDSKVMIVIKSVVVPAINFISNVHQLSAMGVPVRHIFSGWKAKTVELNSYIKRREQERQLQNDLFVAEGRGDSVAIRKLSTRIQSLQDSYKRMSIWPLLEAGEFGAITDGGLSQEDIAIAKGGYLGLIDKAVQKVPEGVRDVVRYGLVTRDTALFKAMSRATQYGDFIAKAVLYDDLIRRKKLSQTEAMGKINEAFINYNRFAGRVRSYAESMGGTWFMHYKLRSMKVAQQMLHENPFRAIVHSALMPRLPLLGTVGNPLTDNFLFVWLDGRLGYSLGPGMLFRAPSLNPWWNMTH